MKQAMGQEPVRTTPGLKLAALDKGTLFRVLDRFAYGSDINNFQVYQRANGIPAGADYLPCTRSDGVSVSICRYTNVEIVENHNSVPLLT